MPHSKCLAVRRDPPGRHRVSDVGGSGEDHQWRVRGTYAGELVVLHVQHDMRSVQHDLGAQDGRDSGRGGRRPPVVGRQLRGPNNGRVLRGVLGRGPGEIRRTIIAIAIYTGRVCAG